MVLRSLLLLTAVIGVVVAVEPRDAAAAIPDQPPSPSPTHWQGWYVGGDVGMADTTNSFDQVGGETEDLHMMYGGTAGLVGGYNRVNSNGLFYGGEADINYMSNFEHLQNGGAGSSTPVLRSSWGWLRDRARTRWHGF